jgi:hypothetical protein
MREDPMGYQLPHSEIDDDTGAPLEWAVIRVADQTLIGFYATRDEAVDAAEADSPRPTPVEPELTGSPID